MVCGTFTVKCTSQADADRTAALFNANKPPPTSVTISGDFVVTAVFPPCPSETSFSTEGAAPP
jgi:hypothetical protein